MKKENAIKMLILVAYSVLLFILVINHEYWFDEGQAWNIARDNDIAGIFSMMKYEGHPPLWHLILKLFTSLGCSWRALGLVSWGIMTITAGVILFCLPINLRLQAALLMSSGMLYTNSVISRIYCVIYLLLAVIVLLYPHRKKHPILFGLTVALLANTHICMCGLVGAIGIFMLIDFFKNNKSNSRKQNISDMIGLGIAGAGVIALLLVVWGSFSANCFTSSTEFTFKDVVISFIMSFQYITKSGISPNIFSGLLEVVLLLLAQSLLILAIILLRRKRRTLTMLLVFAVFYMVMIGVIWYTLPSRGSLFLYTLVMIYIMGSGEEPVPASGIKIEIRSLNGIISLFKRLDAKTDKSVSLLFAAMLLLSVPSGAKYMIEDIRGEFDPSKATAEFIRWNISEETLLVSFNDDYAALMTYLPERKIYSLNYGRFYSYCSHEIPPDEPDESAFREAAVGFNEVWLIDRIDKNAPTMIYSNDNSIGFYVAGMNIGIFSLPKEEFIDRYL